MKGTPLAGVCETLTISNGAIEKSNQPKEGLYEPRTVLKGNTGCGLSECHVDIGGKSVDLKIVATNYLGFLILYACDEGAL